MTRNHKPFRANNEALHKEHTASWNEKCAMIDTDLLRRQLAIDFIRANGGLTYEQRKELKAQIAIKQKSRYRMDRFNLKGYGIYAA